MPLSLLLAMQAAGMVTDYLGVNNQSALIKMGGELQQSSIESNIEQTRLEAEDSSLQALKNLRKNLGTQAALFAARGTRTGAGSALSAITESVGNFNADERMRRMNLLGRTTALKGEGLISRLNQAGETSKLWQGFAQRSMNRFSTQGYSGSSGSTAFAGSSASGNYGSTQRS